jgi:hypothetical protein
MPVPTPRLDTVHVRGDMRELDADKIEGEVIFTPSLIFVDPVEHITVFPVPYRTTLVDGVFDIELPCTDDPDMFPTGFTYQYRENWPGGRTFNIEVPYNTPVDPEFGRPTIWIDSIQPAMGEPLPITYVTLQQMNAAIAAYLAGEELDGIVTSVNEQTGDVVLEPEDIGAAPSVHSHADYVATSSVGANNGVASLDANGDVPLSQLGNVPPGGVTSVNGETGAVVLDATDVGAAAASHNHAASAITSGTFDAARIPDISATYVPISSKGANNGVASLNSSGKVPLTQLPEEFSGGDTVTSVNGQVGDVTLDATDVGASASGHTHTGLGVSSVNGDTGDVTLFAADVGAIPTSAAGAASGVATLDSGGDVPLAQLGNVPAAPVTSVNGDTGVVVLTASDVSAIPVSEKGANNGVATLGSDGLVPTSQLPTASGGDSVSSVNGEIGVVVLDAADVGAAAASHTHGAADIASGTIDVARLPNATNSVNGIIRLAGDLAGSATSPTVPGLATKANSTHTHNAADVDAGTLNIARVPTGTTGTTVALGNHTHAASAIDSGTIDIARIPTGSTGTTVSLGNHVHSTAGITSGTFDIARIPTGTSGTTVAIGNDSRITGALQAALADAKGDLLAATAADTFTRFGVGTNGQVLTADSAEAVGMKWATPAGGGSHPTGIAGALFVCANNATTAEKLWASYQCDGTADNVEIESAKTAAGVLGLRVVLSTGDFDIAARMTYDGGGDVDVENDYHLIGQGPSATRLNMAAALATSAIHITGVARVHFEGFGISIANTAASGITSNATLTSTAGYRSFWMSSFRNLEIVGDWVGTHAGWAMNLGSPFRSVFENIDIGGVGNGIRIFSEHADFNPGDCDFDRMFIDITNNTNGGRCISIESTTVAGVMNQMNFSMVEMIADGAAHTGIYCGGSGGTPGPVNHMRFFGSNIEQVATCVNVDRGEGNEFDLNYIECRSGVTSNTFFLMGANAFNNTFRAKFCYNDGATRSLYTDGNTLHTAQPNIIERTKVYANTSTTITGTRNAAGTTVVRDIIGEGAGTYSAVLRPPSSAGSYPNNTPNLGAAGTYNTDWSSGSHFRLSPTASFTLANPTNPQPGQRVVYEIRQDATGGRAITLGSNFRLGTDITAVTLSTAANKTDYLGCIYNATDAKFDVVMFIKGF